VTNLQREISLLRVAELLHLTSELALLHREASELTDSRSWFCPNIIAEYTAKEVKREAPSAKETVRRNQITQHVLLMSAV
jgi:hypothetical protein